LIRLKLPDYVSEFGIWFVEEASEGDCDLLMCSRGSFSLIS